MTRYSDAVQSLVWGAHYGGGSSFEATSPLDDSLIAAGELLGDLSLLNGHELPRELDFASLGQRLAEEIRLRQAAFVEAARLETGFTLRDCNELIDGALAYATAFAGHPSTQLNTATEGFTSNERRMELVEVPYGTVAVILPNNAFLPLALACLLNALRAGNRVVLRSPTQSARSAALLAEIVHTLSEIAPFVSIVICAAPAFVDWFMASPGGGLLHFFGSSRRAAELVARGFDSGKTVLIDGEGNAWTYVDRSADPNKAANLLVNGAFRYNGQTCTSINGAIVHPELYDTVTELVIAGASRHEVGPVFNELQAQWCLDRIAESRGEIKTGGTRRGPYVAPTIVTDPHPASDLVREGIFGPGLWIAKGNEDDFADGWRENVYPLCAAVLQEPSDPVTWANRLPNLARLVLNGDPSIEDPFEYWGGYPPAGQNSVSRWPAKYLRTVQIDKPFL
ncbi:aldehyde dehydrogenase [bacterium]|nr:MAG: aldehyde dehydrogenase [bacterium]